MPNPDARPEYFRGGIPDFQNATPGFVRSLPDAKDPLDEAYERGRRDVEAEIEEERRKEASVIELLVGVACPKEVRDFGLRHNIRSFAEATWVAGYIAGMKAAVDAQKLLKEDDNG